MRKGIVLTNIDFSFKIKVHKHVSKEQAKKTKQLNKRERMRVGALTPIS